LQGKKKSIELHQESEKTNMWRQGQKGTTILLERISGRTEIKSRRAVERGPENVDIRSAVLSERSGRKEEFEKGKVQMSRGKDPTDWRGREEENGLVRPLESVKKC